MGRFTGVIFLNTFFSPFLTFKQLKDEQTQILSKDNFFYYNLFILIVYFRNAWNTSQRTI